MESTKREISKTLFEGIYSNPQAKRLKYAKKINFNSCCEDDTTLSLSKRINHAEQNS